MDVAAPLATRARRRGGLPGRPTLGARVLVALFALLAASAASQTEPPTATLRAPGTAVRAPASAFCWPQARRSTLCVEDRAAATPETVTVRSGERLAVRMPGATAPQRVTVVVRDRTGRTLVTAEVLPDVETAWHAAVEPGRYDLELSSLWRDREATWSFRLRVT